MTILTTVIPVFFMIGLGILTNKKQLITNEQAEGVNALVSTILFPLMVFNAFFTAELSVSMLGIVAFVFVLHLIALAAGKLIGGKYGHIARYFTATVDGGNICYPLYATIVGSQYISNIVLLDLACMFIVFLVIPMMANKNENTSLKDNLIAVAKSPLIITLALAIVLNLLGVHSLLEKTGILDIYNGIVSMATGPIVALILFVIGCRFELKAEDLKPILKTMIIRLAVLVSGGFLLLQVFKGQAADPVFRIAVQLYFFCPPALVLPMSVEGAVKSEDDRAFMSAYLSMHMVVTLIAYVAIAAMAA